MKLFQYGICFIISFRIVTNKNHCIYVLLYIQVIFIDSLFVYSLFLLFHTFSSISIVDLGQVNISSVKISAQFDPR